MVGADGQWQAIDHKQEISDCCSCCTVSKTNRSLDSNFATLKSIWFYIWKKKNQVFDWIAHNQLRTTYALVQHPCSRNSCDCKVSLYAQSSYLWYQCWELNRSRNNLCTTRLISSTNTLATCSSSLSRWQWQKLWQRSMELDSRNFKILPSPCYSKFQIGWFNFVIVLKNVYIEPLAL